MNEVLTPILAQLTRGNELSADDPGVVPAMNLLIDWHRVDGEPVIFVSLPRAPWAYQDAVRVYWRKRFPAADEFAGLKFNPGSFDDDVGAVVRVDPGELDAG